MVGLRNGFPELAVRRAQPSVLGFGSFGGFRVGSKLTVSGLEVEGLGLKPSGLNTRWAFPAVDRRVLLKED